MRKSLLKTSLRVGLLVLCSASIEGCEEAPDISESQATPLEYNEVLWASTVGEDSEDVAVREILFAPGWVAQEHYHNSDLFIYVLDGEFEVTLEGTDPAVYNKGQALEMKTGTVMNARNVSETRSLKLVVFQVGQTQAPFRVLVQDSVP